ncbi:hypothetical protein RMATCC62417_13585 [Rhizopus microsporus]|nr:hypothetical protein RMATCC62417_13585 [Rhizopus microsporus]
MNNQINNRLTVNDEGVQRMIDNNSAIYYSNQMIIAQNMTHRPVNTIKILPRTRQYRPDVDTYVMKMALSKYTTSFKNMWSIKGRMNKLLHHLINALLELHLAPIREKKYKRFIVKKITQAQSRKEQEERRHIHPNIPYDSISVIHLSRNRKRRLFQNERKRKDYYLHRAETDTEHTEKWTAKAAKCEQRINTYKQVLQSEIIFNIYL